MYGTPPEGEFYFSCGIKEEGGRRGGGGEEEEEEKKYQTLLVCCDEIITSCPTQDLLEQIHN